jgi:hypothetical protein
VRRLWGRTCDVEHDALAVDDLLYRQLVQLGVPFDPCRARLLAVDDISDPGGGQGQKGSRQTRLRTSVSGGGPCAPS